MTLRTLALIDASRADLPTLDGSIIYVISNKEAAYGLKRAADAGISSTYEAREAYDADLAKLILSQTPDLVVCAGWMHILSPTALEPQEEAGVDIINLHPALPGQFDGANAIERAYEAFQTGEITKTGIMIHYVIAALDKGTPIVVREIVNGTRVALEEREKNRQTSE
ncbi:formyl transferase-domain-containing protein [Tuber brumale]|nr:formyl transferase-domain-containing protein [Tuber brumale]